MEKFKDSIIDTQSMVCQILKRNTEYHQILIHMGVRSDKTRMAIWTLDRILHETTHSNKDK